MKLAKSNTNKNLETCGVLAGLLVSADNISLSLRIPTFCDANGSNLSILQKNRKFFVSALIIPKQESTSDSVSLVHNVMSKAVSYLVRCSYFNYSCFKSVRSVRPQMKKRYLKCKISNPFFRLDGFM